MPNIGPAELIIVLAIALIILGPKRLPEAGRSAGRSLREFKNALSHADEDVHHVEAGDDPGRRPVRTQ